ncbi:MAG: hypothetical protein ACODAC_09465 [Pseudomonadota bacterium]
MSDDGGQPGGGASVELGDRRGALTLSPRELEAHCREATVLVVKGGAPAVLAHRDSEGQPLITKIWRRRATWTSDLLRPYHGRFLRSLATLERLGVPTPRYRAHGRVPGAGARFVIYEALDGTPLRDLLGRGLDVDALARFVARLHEAGIYFRGLHLGNVIRLEDGRLGLIDVQDTRFFRRPLRWRFRERNLGILCSHPADLEYMRDGHWCDLVMAYCRAIGASVADAGRMRERVRAQIERREARRARRRMREARALSQ